MKNLWNKFKKWLIRKLGGQVSLPIAPKIEYHVERPITLFSEIEVDYRFLERDKIGTELQIKQSLADNIAKAILEQGLLDIVVHEDPIYWKRRYRGRVRVYAEKGADNEQRED